jgi:hypothetical protein
MSIISIDICNIWPFGSDVGRLIKPCARWYRLSLERSYCALQKSRH